MVQEFIGFELLEIFASNISKYIYLPPKCITIRQTGLCKDGGSGFFANHVEELADKKEVMNVFEYEYETQDAKGKN